MPLGARRGGPCLEAIKMKRLRVLGHAKIFGARGIRRRVVVCGRVRSRPPRPLGATFLLRFLLGIPSLPAQGGQPVSLIPAPGTLRNCHLYQARIKAGM